MTKGIEITSAIITISGETGEAVPGTLVEERVPLTLDILNREVLLVYAIDMNCSAPEGVPGTDTKSRASLSTTSRTTRGTIADTNVLGYCEKQIQGRNYVDSGVGFAEVSPETPTANALDYIGIVSTNDFFVQISGVNNTTPMSVEWRVWCARARVSADIYAALVQGETLSA
jgi:hypothetical protein